MILNFNNLDKDELKKLFKLTDESDFNKRFAYAKVSQAEILKAFKKSKPTKADIRNYICNVHNTNKINDAILKVICSGLFKNAEEFEELVTYLNDKDYENLSKEDKELINKYEKLYKCQGIDLDYETLIKLLCCKEKEINEGTKEELKKEEPAINLDLEAKLKKLTKSNEKLGAENQSLEKKIIKTQEETKEYKAKVKKYEKILSIENIKLKIKDVIDVKDCKDADTLLDELNNKEKEYLTNKDYKKAKYILNVKYALIKVLEVNKDEQ